MKPTIYKDEQSGLEYLNSETKTKANEAICLLHGYGASMYDLYSLMDYVDPSRKYDWFFPNAPIPLNMGGMMGAAWFPIDMQALEKAMMSGSFRKFSDHYPSELEAAIKKISSFCKSELSDYKKIHLGGFSQGAMVSSHVLGEDIENISSLTLLSGNLIGENELEKNITVKNHFKFFQSHGHSDQVLDYSQAKSLFELLKLKGLGGEFVSFNGGHEIPTEVLDKWKIFLREV